ncbi:MAG: ribonuclease P protein component [Ruminococcaceae bacterium]|nr:ribonuclease P protein component [Oscillospiraceae bacterium]
MRYTVSINQNRDFRRLYSSGKSAVNAYLAIYCRRNKTAVNRLGLTVGTKIGKAVVRNRVRRRIREAYRLREASLKTGYDIVIVARTRAAQSSYQEIDRALGALLSKLGISEVQA